MPRLDAIGHTAKDGRKLGVEAALLLHRDLKEMLDLSFACDGSPIVACDMAEIVREHAEIDVTVFAVLRAMRELCKEGKLMRGFRYDKKRDGSVDHYWSPDWEMHRVIEGKV